MIVSAALGATICTPTIASISWFFNDLHEAICVGDRFVRGTFARWAVRHEHVLCSVVYSQRYKEEAHGFMHERNPTADTLLLWGTEDEFQPIEWAERLTDALVNQSASKQTTGCRKIEQTRSPSIW